MADRYGVIEHQSGWTAAGTTVGTFSAYNDAVRLAAKLNEETGHATTVKDTRFGLMSTFRQLTD